jgi:hypothetical protein
MHVYDPGKSANSNNGRLKRRSRFHPVRTTAPPTSSSEIRYNPDYLHMSLKEPITTPPPGRKIIQDTDPILPRMTPSPRRAPRKPYQIETQKLSSPPLPTSRHDPAEHDDSSLPGHLKRLAVEIWQLLRNTPPGPRLMMIAILICLFLFVHFLLQVFASWVNLIYLITGIIASIIVIYEFVKRSN